MGKAGRPVTDEGAQLHRYAARYGCTVRTARTHRANNEPRWLEFMAEEAAGYAGNVAEAEDQGAGGGVALPVAPFAPAGSELRHRQEMTAAALRQWRENARGYDAAQRQRCGADTLRKWEGAVSRSQARYEASLAAETKLKLQMGMLVPIERVKELQRELAPLGLLIRGLKDRVARGILEAEARQQFFDAFGAAEAAWNSEVDALNEKIAELLPCF